MIHGSPGWSGSVLFPFTLGGSFSEDPGSLHYFHSAFDSSSFPFPWKPLPDYSGMCVVWNFKIDQSIDPQSDPPDPPSKPINPQSISEIQDDRTRDDDLT